MISAIWMCFITLANFLDREAKRECMRGGRAMPLRCTQFVPRWRNATERSTSRSCTSARFAIHPGAMVKWEVRGAKGAGDGCSQDGLAPAHGSKFINETLRRHVSSSKGSRVIEGNGLRHSPVLLQKVSHDGLFLCHFQTCSLVKN